MATAARKYDLYSDAFRADTYATFARMREQDPVLCQPGIDGETPIWFVTRYDDAVAVLLDDERFVRDPALVLSAQELSALSAGLPDASVATITTTQCVANVSVPVVRLRAITSTPKCMLVVPV